MKRILAAGLPLCLILCLPLRVCSADRPSKSPFWAMVCSTVLPGGGQFYSESYLRGTLFCVAQSTISAMTLYEHILTEEAHRRYEETGSQSDYGEYAHHFDRRYDLLWWSAGIWVFSMADAFVDAHMYKFGTEKGVKLGVVEEEGIGIHLSYLF